MEIAVIELDASHWRSISDFIDALLSAIGAPAWHGRSLNAFKDSMITGSINEREPPYAIKIINSNRLNDDIRDYIIDLGNVLTKARAWKLDNYGEDTEVTLQIR